MKFEELSKETQCIFTRIKKYHSTTIGNDLEDAFNLANNEKDFQNLFKGCMEELSLEALHCADLILGKVEK